MRFPLILYFLDEINGCNSKSSLVIFSGIFSDIGFSKLSKFEITSVFFIIDCSDKLFFTSERVSSLGAFIDIIRFLKFCGKFPGIFGTLVAIIRKPAFRSFDSFNKVSYCSGVAEWMT